MKLIRFLINLISIFLTDNKKTEKRDRAHRNKYQRND